MLRRSIITHPIFKVSLWVGTAGNDKVFRNSGGYRISSSVTTPVSGAIES